MVVVKRDSSLLVVTENGYGKRTSIDDYRITNRGGKGVINVKTSDRNGKVVAIKEVLDRDELILITTARVALKGVMEIDTTCTYSLEPVGFSPNETLTLRVYPPDGESFIASEGLPALTFIYPLSVEDPTGNWLLDFVGAENTALFVINWTGECHGR